MKKSAIIAFVFVFIFICSVFVSASTFLLYDTKNHPLETSYVVVKYQNKTIETYTQTNYLTISLDPSVNSIMIFVDDEKTPLLDYYKKVSLDKKKNYQEIYLDAIGTVKIFVKNDLDQVVPSAKLSFSCDKKQDLISLLSTDDVGTLVIDNFLVSGCTVYATKGNLTGYASFLPAQGKSVTVTVTMGPKKNIIIYVALALFVILCIIILFWYLSVVRKRTKQVVSHEMHASKKVSELDKSESNNNTNNANQANAGNELFLKSLEDSERAVFLYIKEHKLTTQAKIVRELGVPRTTCARVLSKFEKKGFVTLERQGKLKEVHFKL